MNAFRLLLLLAALTICARPRPAACEPPTRPVTVRDEAEPARDSDATNPADTPGLNDAAPQYEPGYDPRTANRDQIPAVRDDAWGEVVNGLQAAISAPESLRRNEVVTVYLVLRNVSAKTIRVSLPQHPDVLSLRRDGETISYSVNHRAQVPVSFRELKPGHQTWVPSPPIQVIAPGDLGIKYAVTQLKPGSHTIYAGVGSGGHRWVPVDDWNSRKFTPAKGEWTGWLTAARRPMEVLAEQVSFEIGTPEDLPAGHSLPHVFGIPRSVNRGTTEWIQLRPNLEFALDWSQDAHWLLDSKTCNQLVCWGPIPAARLKELNLLEPIRQRSHETIQTSDHDSEIEGRIGALIRSQQPLAEMGLNFVTTMPKPKPAGYFPSDFLARTIRDRRVELENMGLTIAMQRALEILAANDPPMPDDSQFEIVSNKETPPGLTETTWGPKNGGLQAAALMPDSITAEATEVVRLFIRNVSDSNVRLAVSQRAGYDYATATNADGNRLTAIRPYIYPSAFSSVITPELNPGQSARQPPTATLQKILLKPGAVLELDTRTALSFHQPERETGPFHTSPDEGQPAVTHISAEPTVARVTWHLHTANGAAYSQDLKRRIWPAKGAWSGILTTAPTVVQLLP